MLDLKMNSHQSTSDNYKIKNLKRLYIFQLNDNNQRWERSSFLDIHVHVCTSPPSITFVEVYNIISYELEEELYIDFSIC